MRRRSPPEELAFDVLMGLRKGLALCRGMRRQLDDGQQRLVAQAIAEQLELSNWRFERGEPAPHHTSTAGMTPAATEEPGQR